MFAIAPLSPVFFAYVRLLISVFVASRFFFHRNSDVEVSVFPFRIAGLCVTISGALMVPLFKQFWSRGHATLIRWQRYIVPLLTTRLVSMWHSTVPAVAIYWMSPWVCLHSEPLWQCALLIRSLTFHVPDASPASHSQVRLTSPRAAQRDDFPATADVAARVGSTLQQDWPDPDLHFGTRPNSGPLLHMSSVQGPLAAASDSVVRLETGNRHRLALFGMQPLTGADAFCECVSSVTL